MIAIQDNELLREALELVRSKLPKGWSLAAGVDAAWDLQAPDGDQASMLIQIKNRPTLSSLGTAPAQSEAGGTLLISPFLSPAIRRELAARDISFADLTGNVRISRSTPGLFIETTGATSDPAPLRPKRSLKGAKAGRVIRALIDWRPPFRLKDLTERSLVDAGQVSRMLTQLEQEGLLTREPRGAVTEVNWEELIRRWAQDYKVTKANAASYMLEPRGLPSVLAALRATSLRYALTGSVAASMRAAVAPAALAMLYVDDRGAVADQLKLRPAASGGNVVLLVPKDSLPFEGTSRQQDLVLAAPSQVAADLLTGPGRSSSEAEAFLEWMKENEDAWRR